MNVKKKSQAVVAHAFSPSTWEIEASGFLSSRTAKRKRKGKGKKRKKKRREEKKEKKRKKKRKEKKKEKKDSLFNNYQ